MARRHRIWRFLKWAGTFGCAVLLMTFIASAWGYATLGLTVGKHILLAQVTRGVVWLSDFDADRWPPEVYGPTPHPCSLRIDWQATPEIDWQPRYLFADATRTLPPSFWGMRVTLWIPLVFLVVLTLLVWRLDRRPSSGHC